jgi:long-chain acyl-CoA synthetase
LTHALPSVHRVQLQAGDAWLPALLRRYARAAPPAVVRGLHDPAVILFSGGTTGIPKGAVGLHGGLVSAGLQIHAWLRPVWEDWRDIVLLPLPLCHAYGYIAGQSVALVGHNPLALIPDPRDTTDILRTIHRVHPTFVAAVPTLLTALLAHPQVQAGRVDLRSIKCCFSGAAPLAAATKQRFEALTGGRIVEGYSLTEAMLACLCNPVRGQQKVGSVSRSRMSRSTLSTSTRGRVPWHRAWAQSFSARRSSCHPTGRTRQRRQKPYGPAMGVARGSTPATWATSTPMGICSSWSAKRI